MAIYTPPINTKVWYPDKQDLVQWIADLWKYLSDNPIVSENTVEQIINNYLDEHPIDAPTREEFSEYKEATVANTNAIGKINDTIPTLATKSSLATTDSNATQALSDAADADSKATQALSDAADADSKATQALSDAADADSKATQAQSTATSALNKANTAYSSTNTPPYPVTSVDGKTGDVKTFKVRFSVYNLNSESLYYPADLTVDEQNRLCFTSIVNTANSMLLGVTYNKANNAFYGTPYNNEYPSNISIIMGFTYLL